MQADGVNPACSQPSRILTHDIAMHLDADYGLTKTRSAVEVSQEFIERRELFQPLAERDLSGH
jgi:hypothetical protein